MAHNALRFALEVTNASPSRKPGPQRGLFDAFGNGKRDLFDGREGPVATQRTVAIAQALDVAVADADELIVVSLGDLLPLCAKLG